MQSRSPVRNQATTSGAQARAATPRVVAPGTVEAQCWSCKTGQDQVPRSDTYFKPGVSGNPRGRPRANPEIAELAKQHGPACVAVLARMAGLVPGEPPAVTEQARIAAVKELLDRGYGKAMQPLANDNGPLVVDFRWADQVTDVTITAPVIEAVAEVTVEDGEPEVVWQTSEAAD
jgi:hypothetical protein